jgi:glutamine synthetase
VVESPRQVLRGQVERATAMGYEAFAGTELEFLLFEDTYEAAWDAGYRGLTPANRYNIDYSLLGTSRVAPLLRDIASGMAVAGLTPESAKGECNLGQQEIAFRFDTALRSADGHVVYKQGAKEIASAHGKAITFMAKYNEREGNSCHLHMSLRGTDGTVVFDEGSGSTPVFEHFVAGVQATLAEMTLLYAPNINSYKRFAKGSFAPTAIAWGLDNRSCALRVVGHGAGLRVENRVPGGDLNPYLGLAAMLAGGLHGIEQELPLEPALEGNAYESDKDTVPNTLEQARDLFAESKTARAAFGDAVVDHYTNAADVELSAFRAAVTDWERVRGFEPRWSRPTRRSSVRTPLPRPGVPSPLRTGPGSCTASPPPSTVPARSWPRWRYARPAIPSAAHAGRQATCVTCSPTTRRHPSGSSAARCLSPVASTSPSRSRWASSG